MKNGKMSLPALLELRVLEMCFPAYRRLQLVRNGVLNYGGDFQPAASHH